VSISCDCSIDDYDCLPAIFSEGFPVARKLYKCCECAGEIKPGQKHYKATGLWDGKWETYRTCMACYRIRERYCPRGYVFTELVATIKDCLGFDYREVPEEDDDD
jgi:hypothetical protein